MVNKVGINMIIEREKIGDKVIYIASSPDVNVFAEGKTIEEAEEKFTAGVKFHFENFPKDRESLIKEVKETYEMPLLTKIFL